MPRIVRAEQAFKKVPPVRPSAFEADDRDQERIDWVRQLWHDQDDLLAQRDRQIEENLRMLAGQQWTVYSRLLGRFVDITHYLTDKERAWRQRPVVNRLLLWYMLTFARMTENPPVISFQAATGDWTSMDLAEVMDPVFKTLWQETDMLELIQWIVGWMIPGGEAYWQTRVDPNLGDIVEWRGPAVLSLEDEDGVVIERVIPDAPFDRDGNPLIEAQPNGEWEVSGKAFQEREGGLVMEPLSPLQCRGQWGNGIPWAKKRIHMVRTFLTPEEVFDAYGVDVKPEVKGEESNRINELRKVQFGTGFFGATESGFEGLASHDKEGAEGYVDIIQMWHAPSNFPGMEGGTFEQPGGRLTAVTRTMVLRDGVRPANFKYTSPVRRASFVHVPGRPSGTTPQEAQNPIQRAFNKGWAQVLEHRNLSANPIGMYDKSQGISDDDITNEPGLLLGVNRKAGNSAPPIEYVKPPPLGEDVYRTQLLLKSEMQDLGQIEGSEGRAPTHDASGELVKELRFNADRYIGPTQARLALSLARTAEDWMAILPTIWPEEKLVAYTGEQNILRTVTVQRELFVSGKVKVIPDIESMLPEGRGERETRVFRLWAEGMLGDALDPQTQRRALEMLRMPHMARALLPGGQDAIMAEKENGMLARGTPAAEIAILPWQDHDEHLRVHEEFMKSPAFQDLPVEIQQQFMNHWMETREGRLRAMAQLAHEEAQLQASMQLAQLGAAVQAGLPILPAAPEEPGPQGEPEAPPAEVA